MVELQDFTLTLNNLPITGHQIDNQGVLPKYYSIELLDPLIIDSDFEYEFTFEGSTQHRVNVVLYITGYENQTSKEIIPISMNETRVIRFIETVNEIKFTLKIEGIGSATIYSISYQTLELPYKLDEDVPDMEDQNHFIPYHDIKLAVIADVFTKTCLKYEFHCIEITPEDWYEQLHVNKPNLLFVESSWHGPWEKKIAAMSNYQLKDLEALVLWCQKHHIPTVFWNKEDPVHFSRFIEAAKLFDYIFTTDENMVPLYERITKSSNVHPLPFAAEPKIHNPILNGMKRLNKGFFAGSYNAKYHHRKTEMDTLLRVAMNYGIDIYDRNYGTERKENQFPECYQPFVKGKLDYDAMCEHYKQYHLAFNVNSVNYSKTMFSRRVFEILACNTPVVSSESVGIQHYFKDIVVSSNSYETLMAECDHLFHNKNYYQDKAIKGFREVHLNHTYLNRFKSIFSILKLNIKYPNEQLTIVAKSNSIQEEKQFEAQMAKQTYLPNKILFNYDKDFMNLDSEVCPMDTQHFYGDNYLLDLILATKYSNAMIITKARDEEYSYQIVPSALPYGCLMKKEWFVNHEINSSILAIDNNNYSPISLECCINR